MKSKLVPPIAKFLITVQLSLNNKNSIGLGLSDSTLTLQYHSFDSIATVLLHLSLSLSHLPLFHSFNQESSYLPLQDYTMFQPRMSTSSHISPRRRGIIPEIDFVKWIIHPAWMGKRGGHVRREETWPRDRRFIRSIRRRCDLDVTMGLESIETLHPLPLKGCRKTRPYPVSSTSRVQIGIVRRECNDRGIMHGGEEGVSVFTGKRTPFRTGWIRRSIKRGTNGEREPANELEGRSGAVENAAENGGEGERES